MFDDIIIGKDVKDNNSAIKVFDISVNNISENRISYWVSRCILDGSMKIYKDTPEGEKLGQLIRNKASKAKIQNYLDKLVLSHMPINRLKQKIKNQMKESFEKGKKAKAQELRDVLGIRNPVIGGYLV